jgi:hypothetical protein
VFEESSGVGETWVGVVGVGAMSECLRESNQKDWLDTYSMITQRANRILHLLRK